MNTAGRIWIPANLALVAVLGGFQVLAMADAPAGDVQPIAVELPSADRQIDFATDILPILQRNCLACHNTSAAEADVVLESPEKLLAKREAGALVAPGEPNASRVLAVAAHREEPLMPPADNDVGAVPLKPTELGLLQRWIEQGAKDSLTPTRPAIHWRALPDGYGPILATAVAPTGDLVVCSRGNELLVYGMRPGTQQGHPLATLVDPSLDPAQVGPRGAADLDLIRAVAIQGNANWIASAGFRSVKLWQRQQLSREIELSLPSMLSSATAAGNQIAVAGADGTIQLIDLSTDKVVRTWKAHDNAVRGLAFGRGGQVLITAAGDVVRAWHTASGTQLAGWRLSVAPKRLVLLADDRLITAGDDLLLRAWTLAIPSEPPKEGVAADGPTIEPTKTLAGHGRQIVALAALPGEGRQFLSGSVDGTVRRWNADDGNQLGAWIHGDAVSCIAVPSDGSRFVSLGADRKAKIWSVSEPNAVAVLEGDFRQERRVEHLSRLVQVAQANLKDAQVAVETAKKQVATDEEIKNKAVTALEAATKAAMEKTTSLNDIKAKHDLGAKSLAELNEKRVQSETALSEATKRNGESEKEFALVAAAVQLIQAAEEQSAAAVALDKIRQDRQAYLQSLLRDAQTALDARTKERDAAQLNQDALTKQVEEAQKAADAAMVVSQDAMASVARADESIAGSKKGIEAANLKVEQCQSKLAENQKRHAEASQQAVNDKPGLTTAAFSAAGNRLLLADERGRMFIYDAQSFAPLNAWENTATPVTATFAGDADIIVATGGGGSTGGKLVRWKATPTWTLARTIGGIDNPETLVDRVLSLDFNPDGSLLATGGGEPSRSGQISIWNVSDGSLVRSIDQPHSDAVFSLAFSPDGEYLASASADRTAKVFRVAGGELIRTFEGHTDHVTGVAWRANGKQLATSSADRKIKVWNFELGEQQRSIDAAAKEVTGVTFTGIGGLLVSSAGDRSVRIHNADDGALVRTLSGAAGYLFCCAATETGTRVVAGGEDGVLRVWNGEDGAEVFKIEAGK